MDGMNLTDRQLYLLKRKEKKITLAMLAKHIGCSQSLLSRYETGKWDLYDKKKELYMSFINNYKKQS